MRTVQGLAWVAIVALIAAAAVADESSPLTILYHASGVSEGSANVSMDLTLRLYNQADGAVDLREVRVTDPADGEATYVIFQRVSIPGRGSTELRSYVTVPRDEYDRWQRGAQPTVFVYEENRRGEVIRTRWTASRMP